MKTWLLGFDARVPEGGAAPQWDDKRRQYFLVKPEAPYVQSVDDNVWPSLFDLSDAHLNGSADLDAPTIPGVPTPRWSGPNGGLWEDLDAMRNALSAHGTPVLARWLVGISVTFPGAIPEGVRGFPAGTIPKGWPDRVWVGPYECSPNPREPDPAWTSLGWDVADGSRTCPMTDCGMGEVSEARKRYWRKRLNERHLLTTPSDALGMARVLNGWAPEHRPFFPYQLWHVPDP